MWNFQNLWNVLKICFKNPLNTIIFIEKRLFSIFISLMNHSRFYFQRYYYYIERGIKREMVAPPETETIKKIKTLIPKEIVEDPKYNQSLSTLEEEVRMDFEFSVRKSIVDYVLKDPEEKARLHISWTPKQFPQRFDSDVQISLSLTYTHIHTYIHTCTYKNI